MKKDRHTLKEMAALLQPFWALIIGAGFLGAGTVLSNVGLLGTSAVLISQAALAPPILDLMVLIVAVRFFGIARAVLRYVERYVTHDITLRILSRLRVKLYQSIEPKNPQDLTGLADSALLSRLTNDIATLEFFYLKAVAAPLVAVIVALFSGAFLWRFSPASSIILWSLLLLGGVIGPLIVDRQSREANRRFLHNKEVAQIELSDYIKGIGSLLGNQGYEQFRQAINQHQQDLANDWRHITLWQRLGNVGLNYLSYIALWLSLVAVIIAVNRQTLSGVYAAMVILVVWASFEAVVLLPQAFVQIKQSQIAGERVFALTTTEKTATHIARLVTPSKPDIIFNKVSFSYDQNTPLYQNLNLQIPYGQKVAVIGSSGSGKSTLINLLAKFYTPDSGHIILGGCDLQQLTESSVRKSIAVLDQQSYLFNATLRENLLLAKSDADDKQLWQALELAQLKEFVQSLPEGLATYVGENGFKLSGGQRQRVALARIFLQESDIIILDEATQSLDNLTGHKLMAMIDSWRQGRTVINITHWLKHMDQYDQIIVFEQGHVVQCGTEATLLSQEGLYRQMYQIEKAQIF